MASALVGVLVGPSLNLLLAPSNQSTVTVESFFGPMISQVVQRLAGVDSISSDTVLQILPLTMIGLCTVKALSLFFQWYRWELIGERIAHKLRSHLVDRFIETPAAEQAKPSFTELENNLAAAMTQDIRVFKEFIVHYYGGLPREGLIVFFTTVLLIALSPKLFFIFFLGVAPVLAVIKSYGRRIRRRANLALKDNAEMTEWIQQRLLGIETIIHFETQALETKDMLTASASLFRKFLDAARLKAKTAPIIEFFGIASMALVLYLSLASVYAADISASVVISFFSTVAVLAQSAAKLGKYFNSNQEGMAALERLHGLFTPLESKQRSIGAGPSARHLDRVRGHSPSGHLKVERLSASYGSQTALQNFNFDFKPGQIYCVVGSSGAGKSTLIQCLLGNITDHAGTITGPIVSTGQLDFCYLPQQLPVIPTSFEENISYPLVTPDRERTLNALKEAKFELDRKASDRACSIDQLLTSKLGFDGLQFSGGELQRIHLARLFYHRSPIVLIDEGTSALDQATERDVLASLTQLAKEGAIVIMVAHRRQAAEAADVVLQLDNGRLMRFGPSLEMMQTDQMRLLFGN
jgi:ATP-binding cassette, subfamily B, bacterial MsbA